MYVVHLLWPASAATSCPDKVMHSKLILISLLSIGWIIIFKYICHNFLEINAFHNRNDLQLEKRNNAYSSRVPLDNNWLMPNSHLRRYIFNLSSPPNVVAYCTLRLKIGCWSPETPGGFMWIKSVRLGLLRNSFLISLSPCNCVWDNTLCVKFTFSTILLNGTCFILSPRILF